MPDNTNIDQWFLTELDTSRRVEVFLSAYDDLFTRDLRNREDVTAMATHWWDDLDADEKEWHRRRFIEYLLLKNDK